MTDMVKGHEAEWHRFSERVDDAQDPDMKAEVTKTLPTIQRIYQDGQADQREIK